MRPVPLVSASFSSSLLPSPPSIAFDVCKIVFKIEFVIFILFYRFFDGLQFFGYNCGRRWIGTRTSGGHWAMIGIGIGEWGSCFGRRFLGWFLLLDHWLTFAANSFFGSTLAKKNINYLLNLAHFDFLFELLYFAYKCTNKRDNQTRKNYCPLRGFKPET